MLKLHDISRRYGDLTALHPLDLSLDSGKTWVLLGPSGCGKSTLLKIIVRLVVPDQGTVEFDGQVVDQASAQAFRQRTGYVIQDGGLFPHLTAADNVSLLACYLGWEKSRIRQRMSELANLARLPEEALARYPSELSGGQQQRVALMRALFPDPDLLLLDEPLGALDPIVRRELQTDLRDIFRRLGKTVILVSHDLHEAAFFGGQSLLFREGRLVQRGTIADLIESPAEPFVTRFVTAQQSTLDPEASS